MAKPAFATFLKELSPAEVLLAEDDDDDAYLTVRAFEGAKFSIEIDLTRVSNGLDCMAVLRQEGDPRTAPFPDLFCSLRSFAASFYKLLSTAVLGREITGGSGGFGGRVCVGSSLARGCPPFQLRVDHELPCFLKRRWGALRRNQWHAHTRPPTPRRVATVAHSATILHPATSRFSSPHPPRNSVAAFSRDQSH